MKSSSNFQLIVLAVFGLCIVFGLAAFALYKGSNSSAGSGVPVVMWGTISATIMQEAFAVAYSSEASKYVTYVEKKVEKFDQDYIEAVASGQGPDVILIPQDSILLYRNRVSEIPFTAFSQRTFQDTFINEASMYQTSTGYSALPLTLDPLVLYWNRDLFNDVNLAVRPKYWDEIVAIVPKLTQKDARRNIIQSALPIGTSQNILNSKEILAALFLQAGTTIVGVNKGAYVSTLESNGVANQALSFYTQFANPTSPAYSWNLGMQNSRNAFLAGSAAMYIGFASEYQLLRNKNPNLNFDVTNFPQAKNVKTKSTYGRMMGMAISRTSRNADALTLIVTLSGKNVVDTMSARMFLPPVRLDSLAESTTDPVRSVFFDSAYYAKGWYDPNRIESSKIFGEMSDSVVSGSQNVSEALNRASAQIGLSIQALK
jgi:ABC-type glycerol-3-phosphate transport system substrate-binding protein